MGDLIKVSQSHSRVYIYFKILFDWLLETTSRQLLEDSSMISLLRKTGKWFDQQQKVVWYWSPVLAGSVYNLLQPARIFHQSNRGQKGRILLSFRLASNCNGNIYVLSCFIVYGNASGMAKNNISKLSFCEWRWERVFYDSLMINAWIRAEKERVWLDHFLHSHITWPEHTTVLLPVSSLFAQISQVRTGAISDS